MSEEKINIQLEMKPLKNGMFGIVDKITDKCIFVCNRAFNADLIANILTADEKYEVCKNVNFIKE